MQKMNIDMIKKYALIALLLLTTSCLVAGVPYTSDPKMKLSYALQMDTFGRCIPSINLAKDALKEFQKNNDNFFIQYSYVVLSINSEVSCKSLNNRETGRPKIMPEEYFVKAMEIDTEREDTETAIEILFNHMQKTKEMPLLEAYHKYKIIQFYHLVLANKYGRKDSKEKTAKVQKLIDSIRQRMKNRQYSFDYSFDILNKYSQFKK